MITLGRFSIEEVLPFTGQKCKRRTFNAKGIPCNVKMNSLRFQTFAKSLKCVSCGLIGNIFLLQYHPIKQSKKNCFVENCSYCELKLQYKQSFGHEVPHFNLYHEGPNKGLILMTKDHVYPKSKGGKDSLNNLVTMCEICNRIKSDSLPKEFIPCDIVL